MSFYVLVMQEADMREGPEHRMGWRGRSSDGSSEIEVFARHIRRSTVPRTSSEISRNLMRGRPSATMVETISHEWLVLRDGRQVGFMRQNPNGTFHIGALWVSTHGEGILQAAVAAARRVLGPAKTASSPSPTDPSDGSPGP